MRGFSLLELLVATACTSLVAGAVLALMVGSAAASRREWGAMAARREANVAVAAVVDDLRRAGQGLERADAIQVGGERIAVASVAAGGGLRIVRTVGAAREIQQHGPGPRYTIEAASTLRAGDAVVAVGLPERPLNAPLPQGLIVAITPRGTRAEVVVAWRAPEAAALSSWGPPRALLPVEIRRYEVRSYEGALQLRRSDGGGTRQPIVDGLDRFRIVWIVDADGDGTADARRDQFTGRAGERPCAVVIEAAVTAVRTRLPAAGSPPAFAAETATRWVTLAGC
jgi:hypothetical protein